MFLIGYTQIRWTYNARTITDINHCFPEFCLPSSLDTRLVICPKSGGLFNLLRLVLRLWGQLLFQCVLFKHQNTKHDLTALRKSQTVVVPVIFISGRSLCISLSLCVTHLIFSHPACPSSSVSSWRFDSVTAVERRLQSCGGMSAGVRCLSWLHWLLCVGVCVHACVNLMFVCAYFRCAYVEYWLCFRAYQCVTFVSLCASWHCHSRFNCNNNNYKLYIWYKKSMDFTSLQEHWTRSKGNRRTMIWAKFLT